MASPPAPATWLFRKDNDTIWVVRPEAYLILLFGPGTLRKQYRFAGEDEMQSFQVSLAENLTSSGWILWGVDRDRRTAERRSAARGTSDRRTSQQAWDRSGDRSRAQL